MRPIRTSTSNTSLSYAINLSFSELVFFDPAEPCASLPSSCFRLIVASVNATFDNQTSAFWVDLNPSNAQWAALGDLARAERETGKNAPTNSSSTDASRRKLAPLNTLVHSHMLALQLSSGSTPIGDEDVFVAARPGSIRDAAGNAVPVSHRAYAGILLAAISPNATAGMASEDSGQLAPPSSPPADGAIVPPNRSSAAAAPEGITNAGPEGSLMAIIFAVVGAVLALCILAGLAYRRIRRRRRAKALERVSPDHDPLDQTDAALANVWDLIHSLKQESQEEPADWRKPAMSRNPSRVAPQLQQASSDELLPAPVPRKGLLGELLDPEVLPSESELDATRKSALLAPSRSAPVLRQAVNAIGAISSLARWAQGPDVFAEMQQTLKVATTSLGEQPLRAGASGGGGARIPPPRLLSTSPSVDGACLDQAELSSDAHGGGGGGIRLAPPRLNPVGTPFVGPSFDEEQVAMCTHAEFARRLDSMVLDEETRILLKVSIECALEQHRAFLPCAEEAFGAHRATATLTSILAVASNAYLSRSAKPAANDREALDLLQAWLGQTPPPISFSGAPLHAFLPAANDREALDVLHTALLTAPPPPAPLADAPIAPGRWENSTLSGGGARIPPPRLAPMGMPLALDAFEPAYDLSGDHTGSSVSDADATLARSPSEVAGTDDLGGGVRVPPPRLQPVRAQPQLAVEEGWAPEVLLAAPSLPLPPVAGASPPVAAEQPSKAWATAQPPPKRAAPTIALSQPPPKRTAPKVAVISKPQTPSWMLTPLSEGTKEVNGATRTPPPPPARKAPKPAAPRELVYSAGGKVGGQCGPSNALLAAWGAGGRPQMARPPVRTAPSRVTPAITAPPLVHSTSNDLAERSASRRGGRTIQSDTPLCAGKDGGGGVRLAPTPLIAMEESGRLSLSRSSFADSARPSFADSARPSFSAGNSAASTARSSAERAPESAECSTHPDSASAPTRPTALWRQASSSLTPQRSSSSMSISKLTGSVKALFTSSSKATVNVTHLPGSFIKRAGSLSSSLFRKSPRA